MSSVIYVPVRKRQLTLSRFCPNPRQGPVLLLAVSAIALLVRLGPLLWNSALRVDTAQYDDGVYFAAAQHLIAGQSPYRDFLLLHPPGIALVLAPIAGLGHLIGDANAFVAARLLLITVGAANAALVAWICRRRGAVAGAVGGLLYAVWWASASSETTVFLEPFLNLLLLLAVGLLTGEGFSPRRTLVAGTLIGASVAFKLWPAPILLLLVAWLFWTRGLREALRFVVGCALSLTAVFGPFLAIAPGQMWKQVVMDQVNRHRTTDQSIADRLLFFAGASNHLDNLVPAVLVFLTAAVSLTGIILLVRNMAHGWLWCGILCIQLTELLMATDFYGTHYPSFAAGSCAVLVGLAVGRGIELIGNGGSRRLVIVSAVTLLLLLFAFSVAIGMGRAREEAMSSLTLRSFTHRHQCVWATSTVAIISDQESRNIEHGCKYSIDPVGLFLDDNRTEGVAAGAVLWQHQVQAELARSDAVIVGSLTWQDWSMATRAGFSNRFAQVGRVGSLQLWSEKGYQGAPPDG